MTTLPSDSAAERATMVGRSVAALMGLALVAMFVTSFLYRVENPSRVVRVETAGMPQSMAESGPMKEIMALMQRQKDEPDNPAVHLELAERFLMMGAYDRALIFLDKAQSLDPDNPQIWNDKGIALYNVGRTDEARAAFEAILVRTPDDFRARFNLGLLYKYALRDMDQAAAHLKAVMESPTADEHTKSQARSELESPPPAEQKAAP